MLRGETLSLFFKENDRGVERCRRAIRNGGVVLKSMKLACQVEDSFPYYVGVICQEALQFIDQLHWWLLIIHQRRFQETKVSGSTLGKLFWQPVDTQTLSRMTTD